MRPSLIPTLVVLVLVGLVLLVPERDAGVVGGGPLLPGSAAAGQDVAELLAQLPVLELTEPPAWAQARGIDSLARHLDRLAWGSHSVLLASRQALREDAGKLTELVLVRLQDLGESDPILAAKLIGVLGDDPAPTPGVVDELVRRALSPIPYVAMAALRVLAYCPDDAAIAGVEARLNDEDLELRGLARAALAERTRQGDPEARRILLDELELTAATPDLAYVTTLGESPADDRALAMLHRVVEEAGQMHVLAALASLLVHGDAVAQERVVQMLAEGDEAARINALRMLAMSGNIQGQDFWLDVVTGRSRVEGVTLMSTLVRAIQTGHPSALQAIELIEQIALDPTHPCQVEALDSLYQQGHPFATERTRFELQQSVGAYLNVTADRLIRGKIEDAREFLPLVEARLADPTLQLTEQLVLCGLLAHVAPELAAPYVVDASLRGDSAVASSMLPMLTRLGPYALAQLEPELADDRAAGLAIFVGATTGHPAALPLLEAIALDPERDAELRRLALDAMVRVSQGPREEVLRRVAGQLEDPDARARARLLFWNYL